MIVIAGTGTTPFQKRSERSVIGLAVAAARQALTDAAITAKVVDGVIPLGGGITTDDLIMGLGLADDVADAYPHPGGTGAVHALALGESLLLSGQATVVLAVFARNGSSGKRISDRVDALPGQHFKVQLERPHGWHTPAQWYAMICHRHMHEYGTTKASMRSVALAARKYANRNPRAMMYDRVLTEAAYDAAPMIADPYQLFDCSLETDGACAIVMTSADCAQRLKNGAVYVRSAELARPKSPDDLTNRVDWFSIGLSVAAPKAYDRAGLSPQDIDAAMIYDCFTFEVIHQLEEAGFCERGGGGDFVTSGATGLDGSLPVNTHGGLLSEGHLGGMNHIVEAAAQLRGRSPSQIHGCENVAVTGWGDLGDGGMAILGRRP